ATRINPAKIRYRLKTRKMKSRKFALGYFYYNTRTGQYICTPTGVEYDTIGECADFVKRQPPPKNELSNYNISEFLLIREEEAERTEFIASCNLQIAVEDEAVDLAAYKL